MEKDTLKAFIGLFKKALVYGMISLGFSIAISLRFQISNLELKIKILEFKIKALEIDKNK